MTRWTWITTALAALALAAGGAAPLILSVGAQPKPVVWNLPHVAAPTYYLTDLFHARALVSSLRCCTILVHLHQRGADVGAGRRRSDHRIHTP